MSVEKRLENIEFIGSFTRADQCPEAMLPEYPFIGRSNVGKSSLINYLCGQKQMAHTSSNPGKTQTLNYFKVENKWHLVDLPGYGYAKVSKKDRAEWQKMINYYLKNRRQLVGVFLLMDFSIPTQKMDLEKAQWLAEHEIPFTIIFTKVDKIKPVDREKQLEKLIAGFMEEWVNMPPYLMVSSNKYTGREALIKYIERLNDSYNQHV